jgi:hypothetical protein
MQQKSLLLAALLAASLVPLHAQQADSDQPPLYRGTYTHVDGVYVTPVAGVPFSATVVIENARPMPDGSVDTKRTINRIGRDSRGRIHNERRRLVSESFHGSPRLIEVHLFDPQTRLSTFYDPLTRIARQQVLPEPPKAASLAVPSGSQVKVEALGASTLNGLDVKGTRRTFTVPAKISGTGAPVEVVDEYWYSEDLRINLLVRRTDPRTGVQTVAISHLKREEPPPAFFQVPQDYRIVDMTPPPGAPASFSGVVAGSLIP